MLNGITPYFGGKRNLAPAIIAELGRHTQYFEPFVGGTCAVILGKQPSQKETVCDLHGDVTLLARVLQIEAGAVELFYRLSRVLFSEALLADAQDQLASTPDPETVDPDLINPASPAAIDRAYAFFLGSWMGFSGHVGTADDRTAICVRWTNNGGSATVRWRKAIDSIPAWHERLQNVVILRRNAFEILDRFEDLPGTAIYADPPYVSESRAGHDKGPGGKGRYRHEFEPADHVRLRDVLAAYRRARVVVSYYDCPTVRDLYRGWTIVKHYTHKHLPLQSGRNALRVVAPELLIVNGPSYAGPAQQTLFDQSCFVSTSL